MGGFEKDKGDGHRFVNGVPENPDAKFWDDVQSFRNKLKNPQDKAVFDKELNEALDKRAHDPGDAAKEGLKERTAKPLEKDPDQKKYEDLAKEQMAVHQQMKETIIKDLLKNGVIHSRAEVEDYRNPNFMKNQHYFDEINKKLMEMQMNMLPYDKK